MEVTLRQGSGYFGYNLLIITALIFTGAIIGGYWWRCARWLGGSRHPLLLISTLTFLGGSLVALYTSHIAAQQDSTIPQLAFFIPLVAGLTLSLLALGILGKSIRNTRKHLKNGFTKRRGYNGIFFISLFIILSIHNAVLVWHLDINLAETLSSIIGRICTQGVVVSLLYLLSELALRSAPPQMKWTPSIVFGLAPLLVILDVMLTLLWQRPLLDVLNVLTSSGHLDLQQELEAGGIPLSSVQALLILAGIIALLGGVMYFLSRQSKKMGLQHSLRRGLAMLVVFWIILFGEEGVGSQWKNTAAWQQIHRQFDIHLSLISPPRGIANFRVTFYPTKLDLPASVKTTRKPDIYIFMVESMRADIMDEKTTPFLLEFQKDCQQLGKTWSGSNATHLSWFSFFHSSIPIYWRSSLEGIENRETFRGSIPMQILDKAGYDIHIRAVCDLGYKDFGLLNFGHGTQLASIVEQAIDGDPMCDFSIAERERRHFKNVLTLSSKGKTGSRLFYTALDTPHYNYYWHDDFTPPFKDFAEDVYFPVSPTPQEVTLIKNRYRNACAWVDSQLADFCQTLKDQGRYDESIIIVTGDHGEEFQENGSWFHCSSLDPEQSNVPILIKWPKSMGPQPVHQNASHLDVMPTLLAALGIELPSSTHLGGRNLLDPAESTSIQTTAYTGKAGETMMLRRGKYFASFSWPRYWDALVPAEISLERFEGPHGPIIKDTKEEYIQALKETFPDAFERHIQSIELIDP